MRRIWISCILLLLLCIAPAVAAGDLLAGNNKGVWLIRPGVDDKTFDVFLRTDGQWAPVTRDMIGKPMTAVAVGQKLHVIFNNNQYGIFEKKGAYTVASSLPGKLLGACEGQNDSGEKTPILLAMVLRDSPPEKPASLSQPASQPANESTQRHCCLYRSFGNQWELLDSRPFTGKDDSQVLLATLGADLYQVSGMVRRLPGRVALRGELHLRRFRNGHWQRVRDKNKREVTLLRQTPEQWAVALLGLDNRLVLLTVPEEGPDSSSQPAHLRGSLSLLVIDPVTGEQHGPAPITRDNKPMVWPREIRPVISRFNDQVALLWNEDQNLRFALCSRNGVIHSVQDLSRTLSNLPNAERVEQVVQYFLWAVMIVILLALFLLPPKPMPQPFLLPPGMKPGNLLKRLVAAILDLIPFNLMSMCYLLFVRNMSLTQIEKQFAATPNNPPEDLIYLGMVLLVLYVVYGTLMELRFGQTLGKKLLGLRVVANGGQKIRLREALLRNTVKIVELFGFMPMTLWYLLILLMFPIMSRNRQRMGDMIARTAVVDAKALPVIMIPQEPTQQPSPWDDDSTKNEDVQDSREESQPGDKDIRPKE